MAKVCDFKYMATAAAALVACCGSVAVGSVTAPSPNATPSSPLRLIGRVHAKTKFCTDIYDHGGLATAAALEGDAALKDDGVYLRSVDLDTTDIGKQHALLQLSQRYVTLRGRARAAIDETKALRTAADAAPTPEQKAALIAYSEAIGGALHRQMLLAEAISRFMMYLQAHEPVSAEQRDMDLVDAASRPYGGFDHYFDPRDRVPLTLTEVAQKTADDLDQRQIRETDDETRAAAQTDAAFSPCAQ